MLLTMYVKSIMYNSQYLVDHNLIWQNSAGNWCRRCPKCASTITHKSPNAKELAARLCKRNAGCRHDIGKGKGRQSPMKGKHHSAQTIELIRAKRRLQVITPEHIRLAIEGRKGYRHSEATKLKMSISLRSGKPRRKHTEETKLKRRLAMVESLRKKAIVPSFNPIACMFIDELNRCNDWHLQHAKNGGEIPLHGYFVDG